MGRDLRENERGHELLDNIDLDQIPEIKEIMDQWDPSQLQIFQEIRKTRAPFFYIHGPPGTRKT